MARRHDHDAAGPADLLAAKAALRDEVWRAMSVKGIARFPAPANRIPNFVGAEAAADQLADTQGWRRARTVKSNPDSPQLPVRVRALRDGKLLYMAVPRLAEADPFFVLDPEHLADPPHRAASIKGAGRSARTVGLDAMEPVDLVVTGCVAVGEDGARLGKGAGSAISSSRSRPRPASSAPARSSRRRCTTCRCARPVTSRRPLTTSPST
jgi:5-formyltetrahydrofolate cyclo-ligase